MLFQMHRSRRVFNRFWIFFMFQKDLDLYFCFVNSDWSSSDYDYASQAGSRAYESCYFDYFESMILVHVFQ